MPASRLCPLCGAAEHILDGEDVWPERWSCRTCGHSVPVSDAIPMFAPDLADTLSGFDPSQFALLARVERDHFWFVPRNRLIATLIARYFPEATRMLEVGCGTGTVLSAIAGIRRWQWLIGSELHPSGLIEARRRLGSQARFVQMDARMIPAREAFDVAGAFDVVEHIAEDEKVFTAMREAVITGGGVILSVPQHPWLWSTMDEKAHHVRRYRRGELEKKLVRAGFEIVFSGSYTVVMLPLMAISRLMRGRTRRQALSCANAEPMGLEFRLPHVVNSLARFILEAEVSLTLAGVHFPVGGSRVVVAIKR